MDITGNYYDTICQDVSRASVMQDRIPALLRKGRIWSFKHDRLLIPQEHLAVMGIKISDTVASSLSNAKVLSVAGNAMHKGAIGAIVLYTLCCTENASVE